MHGSGVQNSIGSQNGQEKVVLNVNQRDLDRNKPINNGPRRDESYHDVDGNQKNGSRGRKHKHVQDTVKPKDSGGISGKSAPKPKHFHHNHTDSWWILWMFYHFLLEIRSFLGSEWSKKG